jgi:hypothetical protein
MASGVSFSERIVLKSEALRMPPGDEVVLIAIHRTIPHTASFLKCSSNYSCFTSADAPILIANKSKRCVEVINRVSPGEKRRLTSLGSPDGES